MKHPVALSILSIFVIAFGIALLGFGGYESVQKLSAIKWVSVNATVDSTSVYDYKIKGSTRWCPDFTYSFAVSGVIYRSDKLEPTLATHRRCFSSRSNAEENIKNLPVGSIITAYYDPNDPSRSAIVIESIGLFEYFLFFCGIILIGGAVWQLLLVKQHFQTLPGNSSFTR